MKILIVGAGPAGLAAASFLDTKKHQITVIEKQKQFSTMGFGVFFFNEGKKLLRKATHDAILPKLLTQIGFKQYIDKQGDVLGDTHYNQLFHVNSYDAVTSIKREDLHGLLRTHLPKEVTVKMGTTIRQIDNFEDHAVVKLSDRTEERYDLVIGADGVHSQLRELFFSYKIKKLNWVARYFWLDKSIPRFLMEWSRDATIMLMPHRDKTTVLSIEYEDIFYGSADTKNVPDELRQFYTSIGLSKQYIEDCYKNSYIAPMQYVYTKKWFHNCVVLIGDAQHAMTPTLGFGTSVALEDAYVLATKLNEIDDSSELVRVCKSFEKARRRRIKILRGINRLMDFLVYRRSRLYFLFWYKERTAAVKISQIVDGLIRLGWKYG